MGRLIKAQPTSADITSITIGEARAQGGPIAPEGDGSSTTNADTYLERVAKFVPAEIVGFFIFANNILKQAMTSASNGPPGQTATMAGLRVISIAWILLLVAWVLCPVYLYRLRQPGDAWKMNASLAFCLFPIWAYAIDAVAFDSIFDGNLASIVLGFATLLSGLFKPGPIVRDGTQAHPTREQ